MILGRVADERRPILARSTATQWAKPGPPRMAGEMTMQWLVRNESSATPIRRGGGHALEVGASFRNVADAVHRPVPFLRGGTAQPGSCQ